MRGRLYTGLDVGASSCHCVAVDSGGQVIKDREIRTGEAGVLRRRYLNPPDWLAGVYKSA
jgi:hypothetical protein